MSFDCQTCGACCTNYKTVEVSVKDENFQWLKDHNYLKADLYEYYEGKTFGQKKRRKVLQMKTTDSKRCIALSGQVGAEVQCSIYEKRPLCCRTYQAESSRCQSARFTQITKTGI